MKKKRKPKEKIEEGKKERNDNSDRKFSRAKLRNCAAVNTKRTIRWMPNGQTGEGSGVLALLGLANDKEPRGERRAGNRRIVLLNY